MKLSALCLGAFLIVTALPAPSAAQQVRLILENGLVTLDATDATPAAILAEWARVGNTRIVDGDRVPGAPLTLKLEGVPERQALDIILRSAAGYIAAARPAGSPGVSAFDRIVVMPVSVNAAAAKAGPAPMAAPAAVAQQQLVEPAMMGGQDGSGDAIDANAAGDGSGAEQPASSTNFDYANPQRYFAARAAQQQQQAEAGQADDEAAQSAAPIGPAGFGTLLSTPGTIPVPEPRPGAAAPASNQPAANPYGLPADAAPGTSTAPPMEPDRSKYINPYAPTPPRPPGQ